MLTSKQAMTEINKILNEILDIQSNFSVSHLQTTINSCVRCVSLADEIIKKDPSYKMATEYLSICEKVIQKLRNDCKVPALSAMIEQKAILVGNTVKRIQEKNYH